jgi:hypothetical protein
LKIKTKIKRKGLLPLKKQKKALYYDYTIIGQFENIPAQAKTMARSPST